MAGIALHGVDGGELRDVTVSDVTMDGVVVPISIRLGSRLKTFREGDRPRHVRGLKLRGVRTCLLKPDARPATVFIDVEGVTHADFAAPRGAAEAAAETEAPAAGLHSRSRRIDR